MALDYELRSEFKNLSLEALMDHTVTCFQGVGDTQNELLTSYFGIQTIRDLANMPFFSMALAIQKSALDANGSRKSTYTELSGKQDLNFAIREQDQDKTIPELLESPIQVLDGLSPSQSLALYDAFRITSVRQLAHNRIMIESRVIQYLDRHGPEAANVTGTPEEMLAILAGDIPDPSAAGRAAEDTPMEDTERELTDHVRSRLEALKDRARERAHNMPVRDTGGNTDRLASIRENQERLDNIRSQRRSIADLRTEGRTTSEGVLTAQDRIAAVRSATGGSVSETREDARRGVTSTTRSRLDALNASRSGGAGAGTGAATTSSAPSTRKSVAERDAEKEDKATGAATAETPPPRERPEPAANYGPMIIAAAVVLVLLIGGVVWFMLSGDDAAMEQAQQSESGDTASTESDASAGASAGGATDSGSDTAASSATGTASVQQSPPPGGTFYVVRRGNSLWRISRMHYNNPFLWPDIFEANQSQIKDPDLIYPEQQFVIPPRRQ